MKTQETVKLDLPAQYQNLNILGECISTMLQRAVDDPISGDTVFEIQLAVHEICNNIIEHAYGHEKGMLTVHFMLDGNRRRFITDLYDHGRCFDLGNVAAPNLAEPQEGGYGLFLAHSLMDDICYEPHEDGNHWRLVKKL